MGLLDLVKKTAGAVFGEGEIVSPALQNKRKKICLKCPFLNRRHYTCKKCKCFIDEKVKFSESRCPAGFWR